MPRNFLRDLGQGVDVGQNMTAPIVQGLYRGQDVDYRMQRFEEEKRQDAIRNALAEKLRQLQQNQFDRQLYQDKISNAAAGVQPLQNFGQSVTVNGQPRPFLNPGTVDLGNGMGFNQKSAFDTKLNQSNDALRSRLQLEQDLQQPQIEQQNNDQNRIAQIAMIGPDTLQFASGRPPEAIDQFRAEQMKQSLQPKIGSRPAIVTDPNDPNVLHWKASILAGDSTMQQVPQEYRTAVSASLDTEDRQTYSPLAARRNTMAASAIVKNYIDLPQYQLTANGLPYLQRIDAALKVPGSVSDQDLLDSLTKLNTAGNAITDAQVKIITDGKSYSDWVGTLANKFKNGGVLSENQRTQIHDIANAIFENYKKGYQPVYDRATAQLKSSGIPKAFWTIPDLNNLSAQALDQGGGKTFATEQEAEASGYKGPAIINGRKAIIH